MTIPGAPRPDRSVAGRLRLGRGGPQGCSQGVQIDRIFLLVEVLTVGHPVLPARVGPAHPGTRAASRIAAQLAVEQTEMIVGHEAAARASNRDCRMATAAA